MPSKKNKRKKASVASAKARPEAKPKAKAADAKPDVNAFVDLPEVEGKPATSLPKGSSKPTALQNSADVSMLTPCQEKRFPMLKLNVDTIARQTWVHRIKEWVVIDGTPTAPSLEWENTKQMIRERLQGNKKTRHIVLVDAGEPRTRFIGGLRNKIIESMSGTWGVWMDDDDVYPSTRVEAAITMMQREKKTIAGCSPHYINDPDMGNLTFQFKVFHENHCTNNTMAFHIDHLKDHKYDDNAPNAEEPKFCGHVTEKKMVNGQMQNVLIKSTPMAQIPPQHAVLQLAHKQNTYNKRPLLMAALRAKFFEPHTIDIVSCKAVGTSALSKPGNFISVPNRVVTAYKEMLFDDLLIRSKYDIVYYLGLHVNRAPWSPFDQTLGGSEQAVTHLCEEWARRGYKVAVYGHLFRDDPAKPLTSPEESFVCNNVEYHSASTFRVSHHYRNLIIWRAFGAAPIMYVKLHADRLILDLHDRHTANEFNIIFGTNTMNRFDTINVKSKMHRDQVLGTLHQGGFMSQLEQWKERIFVQPNGVRREIFFDEVRSYAMRDPFKLIYCSSYERGLEQLLMCFFPVLRKLDPRYTLEVMYGMDGIDKPRQEHYLRILRQPGVTHHGRLTREEVCEWKYKCGFHLYYTATTAEIDCISIRESALCGCIPILSHHSVFAERPGIHYKGNPTSGPDHVQIAKVFHDQVSKMSEAEVQDMRKKCVESDFGFDWDVSARRWLECAIDLPPPPIEKPSDVEIEPDMFDYERDVLQKKQKMQEDLSSAVFST